MKIQRRHEIELTKDEKLQTVREMSKTNPEAVTIILNNPRGHCPFPDCCSRFPCETLSCNADVCSNGYAYRMS